MTTVTDKPTVTRTRELRASLLWLPELWGAIAIAFMWLAVLFSSIYGGDVVSINGSSAQTTTIPSGVFVALFAWLATLAVAKRAFHREDNSNAS